MKRSGITQFLHCKHTMPTHHACLYLVIAAIWLQLTSLIYRPKEASASVSIYTTRLTFASRDVTEFFHDVVICSVAPRLGVDVLRDERITAVVGDVVQLNFGICRVISEVLHVLVRVCMRPLLAPFLTLSSRYSAAYFTNIVFAQGCTQTFNVERLPVNFFWKMTNT